MTQTSHRYVPTRLGNAVSMLVSGLILPAVAIPRYRADGLDANPSRIPLFDRVGAVSLLPHSGDTVLDKPCLMELDGKLLKSSFPTGVPTDFRGVLPVEIVRALIVGSEATSKAIAALPLGNLDLSEVRFEVANFDQPALLANPVAVEAAPPGVDPELTLAVEAADRVAGALSLLMTRGPVHSVTAQTAEALHSAWADAPQAPDLSGALATACEGDPEQEKALLTGIVELLGNEEPVAVLDAARFVDELTDANLHPDLMAHLTYIREVIRAERNLGRFPDAPGLTSARALLLLLLRPEPGEISTWIDDDRNAGEPAIGLATALAGLRKGHRNLSLEAHGPEKLTDWTQRQMANAANASIGVTLAPLRKDYPLKAKLETTDDGTVMIGFKSYRLQLLERAKAAKPIRQRLLAGEDIPGVLERLASILDWPGVLTTAIATSGGFEVAPRGEGWEVVFKGPVRVTAELDNERALVFLAAESDEAVEQAMGGKGIALVG